MAIFALRIAMITDEGKTRKFVIEDNVDVPRPIVVALFAIDTQLLRMDVVGLVT